MLRLVMVGLVGLVGGACVDDSAPTTGRDDVMVEVHVESGKADDATPIDICALAAQLPDEDLCSLVCDYDAFVDRAIAEGAVDAGGCTSFRCTLPGDVGVSVGVCRP